MSVQVLPGNTKARVEVWSCAPASGANQRTATANLTALFTLLLLPPHVGVVPAARTRPQTAARAIERVPKWNRIPCAGAPWRTTTRRIPVVSKKPSGCTWPAPPRYRGRLSPFGGGMRLKVQRFPGKTVYNLRPRLKASGKIPENRPVNQNLLLDWRQGL